MAENQDNVTKLTEEELSFFTNLTADYNSIRNQLGSIALEIRRLEGVQTSLMSTNDQLLTREKEFLVELQNKYGVGSVDLATGIYTPKEG
jgi:hypothetical protein